MARPVSAFALLLLAAALAPGAEHPPSPQMPPAILSQTPLTPPAPRSFVTSPPGGIRNLVDAAPHFAPTPFNSMAVARAAFPLGSTSSNAVVTNAIIGMNYQVPPWVSGYGMPSTSPLWWSPPEAKWKNPQGADFYLLPPAPIPSTRSLTTMPAGGGFSTATPPGR